MNFFKCVTFSQARQTVRDVFNPSNLGSERLPLLQCIGRRSCADVVADEALPDYNRSTVDGYAVKAVNTYGATSSVPSMLKTLGKTDMGVVDRYLIKSSETVYVPTGGQVPNGADAMVMIEDTEVFGNDVAIYKPETVGANVIKVGDDVKIGDVILKRGELITPLNVGTLAALGKSELLVYAKPKVAIISTGDEIVEIDGKTQIGQIRDTNTALNCAFCQKNGFEVVSTTLLKDNLDALEDAVLRASKIADVVLISGGSSIGARDYTEQVLQRNGNVLVHGIMLKPGKPTMIATVGNSLVFGLPGHPMACMLILKLLVLDTINGIFDEDEQKFVIARTSINFPSSPGRITVQPVKLDFCSEVVSATPIFYKSGLVSVLSKADGYLLIPAEQEGVAKGQNVKVYLL